MSYGSIYNLGHKLMCQYAFSRNANFAIFFVAYESVGVLKSKSEYGVIIICSLPFHNHAQTLSCCIFMSPLLPTFPGMSAPFRGVPEF